MLQVIISLPKKCLEFISDADARQKAKEKEENKIDKIKKEAVKEARSKERLEKKEKSNVSVKKSRSNKRIPANPKL